MLSVHHIYHVSKCFSCHKAILMMTGRVRCLHDYICIMAIILPLDSYDYRKKVSFKMNVTTDKGIAEMKSDTEQRIKSE